jgi:predicted GH43/DUF377 family glycosyl hydrolase
MFTGLHMCIKLFFLLFLPYTLFAGNLEEMPSPCILEIKRIEIPGHPYAFNPSMIRLYGRWLICFREILDDTYQPKLGSSINGSYLNFAWLDDKFNLVEKPQRIYLGGYGGLSRIEDGRLFAIDGTLYLIFSDNPTGQEAAVRMCYSKVLWDGIHFHLEPPCFLNNFPGESSERKEKNWVPFQYKGSLFFAYSLQPHRILYPVPQSEVCEYVVETNQELNWRWGELRGSTPAIKIGDEYIALFHSSVEMISNQSKRKKSLHYFMGTYTFSAEFPFEITSISAKPLVAEGFYSGDSYFPYWKPVQVVFPYGMEYHQGYLWVSYGRQDHEMWIMKIDLQQLRESLVRQDGYNRTEGS